MRQTNIRSQHTVSETRQRLFSRICVDSAETTEMTCIQRLQKVEGLGSTHFANKNPIRPVTK